MIPTVLLVILLNSIINVEASRVLSTVIAAFYYLRIIKVIVFALSTEFSIVKYDKQTNNLINIKTDMDYDELYIDVAKGSKNGGIHPADLKYSLSEYFIQFLRPIRDEFDTIEGKELLSNAFS